MRSAAESVIDVLRVVRSYKAHFLMLGFLFPHSHHILSPPFLY